MRSNIPVRVSHCRDSLGIAVCLIALAASGCIRYEETIQVDKSGAGVAAIDFSRPAAGAQPGKAEAALIALSDARFGEEAMTRGLPEGVACEYAKAEAGGQVRISARYRFDSIHKLIAWAASSNSPFSNVCVGWDDTALQYTRAFCPLNQEEWSAIRAGLPDGELVFKLTGPGELRETDGARRDGNTAVWRFTPPILLSGQTIRARYSWALLLPRYLLGAPFFVVMVVLVVARWRRGRAR